MILRKLQKLVKTGVEAAISFLRRGFSCCGGLKKGTIIKREGQAIIKVKFAEVECFFQQKTQCKKIHLKGSLPL
jgi:hypothetical protein